MHRTIVGVMGGGEVALSRVVEEAYVLGALIAEQGWVLLNGGRPCGVMEASAAGAKSRGGLTVGILPGDSKRHISEHIDIPILTGMGAARNVINVLSCDVVIACPGREGTISEIALALKGGKTVILLNFDLGGLFESERLLHASSPEEAVELARQALDAQGR